METHRLILPVMALALFYAGHDMAFAAAPATQPLAGPPAPANAPATQPADPRAAAAVERHKHIDPRWRNMQMSMRNAARNRWVGAPVWQTLKLESLIQFSLSSGLLKADAADVTTVGQVRIAVEGSKSVWMLTHPRLLVNNGMGRRNFASFATVIRFDFDAKDEAPWSTQFNVRDQFLFLSAQTLYGQSHFTQTATAVNLKVDEFTQWGQPQTAICNIQSSSISQLRRDHPEEFREFLLPMLAQFSDLDFLKPGATDVYSVFSDLPADPMIAQQISRILPSFNADDPLDRDAGSEKLRQLGMPGVLAALRLDETDLTEEQKLRVELFVSAYRRRPIFHPAAERRDMSFLIDCLEYDDPAVRAAAKSDMERLAGHAIDFNTSLREDEAARAADVLRKQLLAPPPAPQPAAAPATQPGPQA